MLFEKICVDYDNKLSGFFNFTWIFSSFSSFSLYKITTTISKHQKTQLFFYSETRGVGEDEKCLLQGNSRNNNFTFFSYFSVLLLSALAKHRQKMLHHRGFEDSFSWWKSLHLASLAHCLFRFISHKRENEEERKKSTTTKCWMLRMNFHFLIPPRVISLAFVCIFTQFSVFHSKMSFYSISTQSQSAQISVERQQKRCLEIIMAGFIQQFRHIRNFPQFHKILDLSFIFFYCQQEWNLNEDLQFTMYCVSCDKVDK